MNDCDKCELLNTPGCSLRGEGEFMLYGCNYGKEI